MAQVTDNIPAKTRVAAKKGGARRLRATGWVPAIAYGPSTEPRTLAIEPKQFTAARLEYGVGHLYNVEVEGADTFKAIIKGVQRDPVSRKLDHVDLYAVDMTKPIRVAVRLELIGKPKGLIDGGLLQQVLRRIEIQCLPGDMPEKLEHDVSPMVIGDTIHLSDLALPKGVKATALDDEAVAIMTAPEAEEVKAEEEAPAADAPEAAEKVEEPKKD